MVLTSLAPVVLSRPKFGCWSEMRHVALPPRIFQVRANRERSESWTSESWLGSNVHVSRMSTTKRSIAQARRFSGYEPFRKTARRAGVGHEQDLDPPPVANSFQQTNDVGLGDAGGANLQQQLSSHSAALVRPAEPESYEYHTREVEPLDDRPLQEERQLLVPETLETNTNADRWRWERHDSFSPEGEILNRQSERPAEGSLESRPIDGVSRFEWLKSWSTWSALWTLIIRHTNTLREHRFFMKTNPTRFASGQNGSEPPQQAISTSIRIPEDRGKTLAISSIQRRMRQSMRRVPQAPVVVTATNIEDTQSPFCGATVSSFTTVTLEPQVIISLNIKLPSTTFEAIQTSNRFCVSTLKADGRGAVAASQFAKGYAASPFNDAKWQTSELAIRKLKKIPEDVPPTLYRGHYHMDPVAFTASCTYLRETTVRLGDHAVVFGVVDEILEQGDSQAAGPRSRCLAYIDGCYGQVQPLATQPPKAFKRHYTTDISNVPTSTSRRSFHSKHRVPALEDCAAVCAQQKKTPIWPKLHLVGLQPRTSLTTHRLRNHRANILGTVRELSMIAKIFGSRLSVQAPSVVGLKEALRRYFIFFGSNGFQPAHLAFPDLPRPISGSVNEYTSNVPKIESSFRSIQLDSGTLLAPDLHQSFSTEAKSAPHPARGPLAVPSYSNTVDETAMVDQSSTALIEPKATKQKSKRKEKVRKIQHHYIRKKMTGPLVRPGFVDYPPFRKIISEDSVWNSDTSTRRAQHDRGKGGTTSSVSNPLETIPIQKISSHSNYRLSFLGNADSDIRITLVETVDDIRKNALPGSNEQVLIRKHPTRHTNSRSPRRRRGKKFALTTPIEAVDHIDGVVKAVIPASGLGIRRQPNNSQLEDHLDHRIRHHYSNKTHQLLEENEAKPIPEIHVDLPFRHQDEVQRHQQQGEMTKKADTREEMKRDIDVVLGEIQDYFQARSK